MLKTFQRKTFTPHTPHTQPFHTWHPPIGHLDFGLGLAWRQATQRGKGRLLDVILSFATFLSAWNQQMSLESAWIYEMTIMNAFTIKKRCGRIGG